jgi:Family of unknown function (DUF6445)
MRNFPVLCVDNFYDDPDSVREFALKQDFLESPGNYPGNRTKPLHELNRDLFLGFCSKLFQLYYPDDDIEWNVQTSFWKVGTLNSDPNSPKNMGWIHEDGCLLAGVVYLTPGFDNRLGTTIYRQVGERQKIDHTIMKKFYATGQDDNFDDNITKNNSAFEETVRIGNVYNRLVCFDGYVSHSPSHYYMGDETRMVQVFFVHKIQSKSLTPIQRIHNYDNIPYNSL